MLFILIVHKIAQLPIVSGVVQSKFCPPLLVQNLVIYNGLITPCRINM